MKSIQTADADSSTAPRRFVLVAGEASGDLLGAGLIAALREHYPDAQFAGIGGERMIAAGFDSWHPMRKLSVMGLVEVLRHLPELLAIRRDVVRRALALRPDVVAPTACWRDKAGIRNRGIRRDAARLASNQPAPATSCKPNCPHCNKAL